MANLDWLVVRDFSLIESATWWKDGPEIETGEMRTEDIATEVFFFPAAAHIEKNGTFTNTQRMVQWHHEAQRPQGDQRSELWFMYHLGRRLRERLRDSPEARDRPLLDLTWDYPTEGPHDEPDAHAVLAEISGWNAKGELLSAYTELKDDGSTSSGCWIYCGAYADGMNQTARRKPAREQNWLGAEWAWAWPANRRILYNRASADPDGNPWSERKKFMYWNGQKWDGPDVIDFDETKPPDYVPPDDAEGPDAIAGDHPFIMQSDGRSWLFAPNGLVDGPFPTHYEPQESPFGNPLYSQRANPRRQQHPDADWDPYNPVGSELFPYVLTTYRLTEHHTAGGMSRSVPYLAELQPAMFCEVSPELAAEVGLEHGGWATIYTTRSAIEARVLVTNRIPPITVHGRTVHQVGLPYHWGQRLLTSGDSANDLMHAALDPNVHIMETKAATCGVRPGRRPRGPALTRFVESLRAQA
jgi:formate dehydrogenase major subunit